MTNFFLLSPSPQNNKEALQNTPHTHTHTHTHRSLIMQCTHTHAHTHTDGSPTMKSKFLKSSEMDRSNLIIDSSSQPQHIGGSQ